MAQRPWRHERKFRLSPEQHAAAARWCRRAMRPDPHAQPDGDYFVRSVYFDSISDCDFLDKAAESLSRKKIRLRVYSEQPEVAHLELKKKENALNRKERQVLALAEAEALIDGNPDVLLRKGTEAALRFYAEMKSGFYRPVVSVEYEREAYVLPFGEIRVTFDKAVRYSVSDYRLQGSKPMSRLFPDGSVILEVKYDREFPRWASAWLQDPIDEVQTAISKFGLSLAPWRSVL